MLILIGSQAFFEHIYLDRTPKDTDIIGTYDEIVSYAKSNGATSFVPFNRGKYIKATFGNQILEAEIAWKASSAEAILDYVLNDEETRKCGRVFAIPSLNVLYMIKMAHRFKKNSPHFLKTMSDIHLMRNHGAILDPKLNDIYKHRQKETYNYSHPKLNQDKKSFFDASVKYIYDHDSIHEAIKVHDKPAYQSFKKENEEVNCSRELFESCDRSIQLAAVYEESCVLAIERSLVPFPNVKTPKEAFEFALMKVCTSITSGWFREFAWENYHEVLKLAGEFDFWETFQKALRDGKVPLHGH